MPTVLPCAKYCGRPICGKTNSASDDLKELRPCIASDFFDGKEFCQSRASSEYVCTPPLGRYAPTEIPEERISVHDYVKGQVDSPRNYQDLQLQTSKGHMFGRKLSTEFQVCAAVGSSLRKDLSQAIISAGDKLVSKLGQSPSFVVAAMMVPVPEAKHKQVDPYAAAHNLKKRFPDIPFVGALSLGGLQMEGNGKSAQYPVVAFWGIPDPGGIYVISHSAEANEGDARKNASNSLSQVPPEAGSPPFVFAFAGSGSEQAINRGIRSVLHANVAIMGGTPHECSVTGRAESWQISSTTTTNGGVCAAYCWPSVKFDPLPLLPWFSLEPKAKTNLHPAP